MSGVNLDFSQLTEFENKVMEIAQKKYPQEAKKFMQRAGNAMRKRIREQYSADGVGRKTGNIRKGLTRGRAYVYAGNEYQVRVKNRAPHAHLIEHGHEIFFHHSKRHNFPKAKASGEFTQGFHSVGKSVNNFGDTFTDMAEKFVDDFINKGFS